MAAADYLDDDEFDDYNPHPYGGGYDISATYGSPIPPSPATCYPVSSPAALPAPTAPLPHHQPSPPRPQPPPAPVAPPLPSPPPPAQPPAPVAEPYYWPKPHDYGDAPPCCHHQPAYATPEVFRGWPYLPGAAPCRSTCGRDYWRQCMRGLDYLFGHTDGYGERQIGVDCLGVPVYANRKGAVEDAVVVEVAPPPTATVEWHEHDAGEEQYQSNRLSWYGNTEEENYAYAQPTYTSFDASYEHQSYGGVSDGTTWFPNQSYQEIYREEESQYQDYSFYNEDSKISSQPICYNQHFGEQPLHFQVEPPETVSSYKLEYYEDFSTYNDQNSGHNLESSGQSYEIQPYTHTHYDHVEPYRPSWSVNPGYYEACTEGMTMTPEYDNHTLASGECWDMSSLFVSPFYPQVQVYEQSHGDENV